MRSVGTFVLHGVAKSCAPWPCCMRQSGRNHCAALQVGDKLYAHLPGASGIIASPVVAIKHVIEHSAFNLQTLRGEGCSAQSAFWHAALRTMPFHGTAALDKCKVTYCTT